MGNYVVERFFFEETLTDIYLNFLQNNVELLLENLSNEF